MRAPPSASFLFSLLAALIGCQSSGDRTPAGGAPPAATDTEEFWEATRDPEPASAEPGRTEDPGEQVAGGLGTEYRAVQSWRDETTGVQATLVYISATGTKPNLKPYPLIYSSDPNNTYFHRENSGSMTVRRLYRDEMARFLGALSHEGFERLPWEEHGFRAKIGGDRAFYLYRDGVCRRVVKPSLAEAAKETFTRVEKRIIELNRAN